MVLELRSRLLTTQHSKFYSKHFQLLRYQPVFHFNLHTTNPIVSSFHKRSIHTTRRQLSSLKSMSLIQKSRDPDAPPLPFRWFYATDIPNYMPKEHEYKKTETPKKFKAFSTHDSKRLEGVYQLLKKDKYRLLRDNGHLVPVNEDYLFEVDMTKKEMKPVYWDGAIYEVRRGTWFTDEGHPVSEELADELERGFLKLKPYAKREVEGTASSNGIYDLKGFKEGKKVVYVQDQQVAYIINELYGGELQLKIMKNVISGPTPGATRVTRGFRRLTAAKATDEKKDSKDAGGLSSIFELELNQMFKEKSSANSYRNDDESTKHAMEYEIAQDYNEDVKEPHPTGERKVDHLIFCIHGIGQMLGTKFQGVNFVHTVNILRQNIKKAYSENKDFQKLLNDDTNCRIQVLPITWRHKVDFQTEKAADDLAPDGKPRLPSLADITVDDMKPLRNLLGSVLLDVLLYYEPRYLNQILEEVVSQANMMYAIFKERNPDFNGKVSIIGHSLGSAIGFDILSLQPNEISLIPKDPKHFTFEVNNYFAIGSPIGAFNLLKRKNVGSRTLNNDIPAEVISKPRVENFYNIFHPCDPIGYRVEPLISPEFREFEPESVPFLIEDFNKQLSTFASFHNNLIENANEAWKTLTSNVTANVSGGAVNLSKLLRLASKDEEAELKQLTSKSRDAQSQTKPNSKVLTSEQLRKLSSLNYNGRVDYALQQGYFDLTIISSISAHVSYFEDKNTAAFILKETLTNHETVKEKKVRILPGYVISTKSTDKP